MKIIKYELDKIYDIEINNEIIGHIEDETDEIFMVASSLLFSNKLKMKSQINIVWGAMNFKYPDIDKDKFMELFNEYSNYAALYTACAEILTKAMNQPEPEKKKKEPQDHLKSTKNAKRA